MTRDELEAIRKRIEGTAPISNAAHDCRALLAYVDELHEKMRVEETEKWIDLHAKAAKECERLRAVVAAADAWLEARDGYSAFPDMEDPGWICPDPYKAMEAYRAARKSLEEP